MQIVDIIIVAILALGYLNVRAEGKLTQAQKDHALYMAKRSTNGL